MNQSSEIFRAGWVPIAAHALSTLKSQLTYDRCMDELLAVSRTWACESVSEFRKRGYRHVADWAKVEQNEKSMAELFVDGYFTKLREWERNGCIEDEYDGRQSLSRRRAFELADTFAEEWTYPTQVNGDYTLVNLDSLQPGLTLKVDTEAMPILRRLCPFHIHNGVLSKSYKYTNRDGTVAYRRIPIHRILADFLNTGDTFRSDDCLDLTRENLQGQGRMPDDEFWRKKVTTQGLGIARFSNPTDWVPAQPVRPAGCEDDDEQVGQGMLAPAVDQDTASWLRSRGEFK